MKIRKHYSFAVQFKQSLLLFFITQILTFSTNIYIGILIGRSLENLIDGTFHSAIFFEYFGALVMICFMIPAIRWLRDKTFIDDGMNYFYENYKVLIRQKLSPIKLYDPAEAMDIFIDDLFEKKATYYKFISIGIMSSLILITTVGFLLIVDPFIGGITIIINLCHGLINDLSSRQYKKVYEDRKKNNALVAANEMTLMKSMEMTRSYCLEEKALDVSEACVDHAMKTESRLKRLESLLTSITEYYDYLALIIFILALGTRVTTVSNGLALIPTCIIAYNYSKSSMTSLIDIHNISKKFPTIDNRLKALLDNLERVDGYQLDDIQSIEMKSVDFAYEQGAMVLKDYSVSFNGTDIHRIHGSNGAGKTTAVKLMMGLYDRQKGEILINGMSIDKINLQSLRSKIAYVSQHPFLVNDTVRNNILLFTQVSEDQVDQLLDQLGIKDIGDKVVTNNGSNLSGGQKQKISIARALIKRAHVYIFDEPYNNLDPEQQKNVKRLIENINGMRLVISHT